VTIRDNSGIVSGGKTGAVQPDAEGGLERIGLQAEKFEEP
jgi:hypothetical protein